LQFGKHPALPELGSNAFGVIARAAQMLRINLIHYANMIVFQAEGKLAGIAVEELRSAWIQARPQGDMAEFVDLTEVTRVDANGLHLLNVMYLAGVRFVATSPYTVALLEDLEGAVVDSLPEDREVNRVALRPEGFVAPRVLFRSTSGF
jgi:hypothetical protein